MHKDGYKIFNNGIVQRYFLPGTEPEGFKPGGLPKTAAHKEAMRKSRSTPEYRAAQVARNKKMWAEKHDEICKKREETIADKFGSLEEYNKQRLEKRDETLIEKYGSLEDARKHARQAAEETMIERYGVRHNFCSGSPSLEKRKETWLENYGYDHPNKSEIVQEKRRNTCLTRYGVDAVTKSDEFKKKVLESIITRYGSIEAYKQHCLDAHIEYNQEHYGVDYYFQSDEFKEKSKQTKIERYGSEEMSWELVKLESRATCLEKYGDEEYFRSPVFKDLLTEDFKLNRIQRSIETKRENGTFNKSKGEAELYERLIATYGSENVITNYQDIRYAQESGYQFKCDFYVKSEDLFIELNLHPTHGGYPFNVNNEEDLSRLFILENSESEWDRNVAYIWGHLDVLKVNIARKNNLNHRMVYNLNEFYRELQC